MSCARRPGPARRRGLVILGMLLLYAASLAAGLSVIIGYSTFWRQEGRFFSRFESMAEELLAGSLPPDSAVRSPNLQVAVFAADGTLFAEIGSSNQREWPDTARLAGRHIGDVLAGGSLYRPVLLFTGGPIPSVFTLYAAPVVSGDAVAGAVFITTVIPELTGSLLGFLCFDTIAYWTAAGCLLVTFGKKRRLDEMRQAYIDNTTHALKAPIASVKAITETLSDVETLDEDQRMAYYGTILQEMNVLNHLVMQMLELSRLQSGGRRFVKRETSFQEVFGPAIEKFQTVCDCMRIRLETAGSLLRLPPLDTDVEAARSVLEILLENAVKYTRPGNTIRISASAARRRVTVCVWDNGGVIPEQNIPYIFERFYKGSNSGFSSSGLGLAIARETVAGLREKIWVECVQPNETMFFFTLARHDTSHREA